MNFPLYRVQLYINVKIHLSLQNFIKNVLTCGTVFSNEEGNWSFGLGGKNKEEDISYSNTGISEI